MSENTPSQPTENAQKLSPEAASRRLIMLRGLGKGSAALTAAALPLSSLAQGSTLLVTGPVGVTGKPAYRCSVSGMHSAVTTSNAPVGATICGGYSPGWWGQEMEEAEGKGRGKGQAESAVPRRWWPVLHTTTVKPTFYRLEEDEKAGNLHLFTNSTTLFDVMRKSEFADSDTRHWIGAYLNGMARARSGLPFPYSGEEVLAFYRHPNGTVRKDFYTLVTSYLERHA